METMTPQEARQVLIDAQKSVAVDTSGIAETEREITQDGISVNVHIVKPEHSKDRSFLYLYLFMAEAGY